MTEVRPLRWYDLPFIYRMAGRGTRFDSQFHLAVGDGLLRWFVLLSRHNIGSYVLPWPDKGGLGQLYFPPHTQHAHLTYLAPSLKTGENETVWFHLLDGLSAMAGQRGAVSIMAEVEENSREIETLRQADFAVYARQDLWVRQPSPLASSVIPLRRANSRDQFAIQTLYNALVPALIKRVETPPSMADACYVYDDGSDSLKGMIVAHRGRKKILMEVYLHPEVHHQAQAVLHSALVLLSAQRNSVYCRLRRYMDWVGDALVDLDFEVESSQAVMARHTAVRITQPAFKPLQAHEGRIPTTSIVES